MWVAKFRISSRAVRSRRIENARITWQANSRTRKFREEIDLQAFEMEEKQQDGYNDIPGEVFAKFLEINNGTLRATLEDYDCKKNAECDKRLLAIRFCLLDNERALNKNEHEWYKILLDTGASVSLLSESQFLL